MNVQHRTSNIEHRMGKDEETEEFGEGRKVILCLLQVNTQSYPRTEKA